MSSLLVLIVERLQRRSNARSRRPRCSGCTTLVSGINSYYGSGQSALFIGPSPHVKFKSNYKSVIVQKCCTCKLHSHAILISYVAAFLRVSLRLTDERLVRAVEHGLALLQFPRINKLVCTAHSLTHPSSYVLYCAFNFYAIITYDLSINIKS